MFALPQPPPLTLPPALTGSCRLAVEIVPLFPDELVGVAELYQVAEATAELIPHNNPYKPDAETNYRFIVAIFIHLVLIPTPRPRQKISPV